MQECPYCGQQNSDLEDRCVYCGELLYIKVDHQRNKSDYDTITRDINHQYASKIANELLEDERKRVERAKKNNIDYDDFNDLTDELLNSDDIYVEDNIEDDSIFKEDKTVDNPNSFSHNMFEETLADLEKEDNDDDSASDVNISTDSDSVDSDDEDELIEYANEPEDDEYTNISKEDLISVESSLKRKLKRNKKLETRIGLSFKNIALVLNDINGPVEVLGNVSTNTLFENHCLQLSIICYDNNHNEIDRNSTILIMNSLKTYYDFSIKVNPNIRNTAILILMPEILDNIPTNASANNESKPMRPSKNKNRKQKRSSGDSIFIEHMRDIEHRIGMNIDNTSVLIKSEKSLEIVGEISIKHPDKYDNIKIVATCYDSNNKIIATENTHINTKVFLGFDTLSIKFNNVVIKDIERIRLYPTLQ